MYYPDHHVHTSFSPDSQTAPAEQAEQAVRLGMPAVCFTDHMDFDYPARYGVDFNLQPDAYLRAMADLKERFKGRIDIRAGVEIGLETALRDKVTDFIVSHDWDFVIGSIHLAGRMDPYFDDYFAGRSEEEAYRSYFEATLDCLEQYEPVYDVLGHLDYVFRCGRRSLTDAWEAWPELMDAILRLVVDKGLGLDVNTGGFKGGLTFQHPHDSLLKRYRELGGELITFGSDAHRPRNLGERFPETGEKLKAMGFRYYASYKKRRPEFQPL